jgi:hypothetical protein
MVVNEDEYSMDKRGAYESIAGKPAPTGSASHTHFLCKKLQT